MKIQQRGIVELNFEFPDGKLKPHPAPVVSNQAVLDTEEIFYVLLISTKPYNDEFTFEISNSMVTKPLPKKSYVKCQLIQAYTVSEVLSKISSIKIEPFNEIKKYLFETVF